MSIEKLRRGWNDATRASRRRRPSRGRQAAAAAACVRDVPAGRVGGVRAGTE
jgi:hypothetical protein